MIAALLLAQAAASTPHRFSVLADPCAHARDEAGNDVVVCGDRAAPTPRLPLPAEREMPVLPDTRDYRDNNGGGNYCGMAGCTVGFGQPIVAAALKGAASLAHKLTAKHVDKSGRVPIDLSEQPSTADKILP